MTASSKADRIASAKANLITEFENHYNQGLLPSYGLTPKATHRRLSHNTNNKKYAPYPFNDSPAYQKAQDEYLRQNLPPVIEAIYRDDQLVSDHQRLTSHYGRSTAAKILDKGISVAQGVGEWSYDKLDTGYEVISYVGLELLNAEGSVKEFFGLAPNPVDVLGLGGELAEKRSKAKKFFSQLPEQAGTIWNSELGQSVRSNVAGHYDEGLYHMGKALYRLGEGAYHYSQTEDFAEILSLDSVEGGRRLGKGLAELASLGLSFGGGAVGVLMALYQFYKVERLVDRVRGLFHLLPSSRRPRHHPKGEHPTSPHPKSPPVKTLRGPLSVAKEAKPGMRVRLRLDDGSFVEGKLHKISPVYREGPFKKRALEQLKEELGSGYTILEQSHEFDDLVATSTIVVRVEQKVNKRKFGSTNVIAKRSRAESGPILSEVGSTTTEAGRVITYREYYYPQTYYIVPDGASSPIGISVYKGPRDDSGAFRPLEILKP
ncbi:MAG: hypothetical protein KDK66_07455 [Deltaproteobacteria bacterium]|nr:hypothetical protein [Deltaproteobacteria bacterium]